MFLLLFSYLIASMGLQLLWSFGLACLDIYSLKTKRDLHNPVLVSLFVVGDWVSVYICMFCYPVGAWRFMLDYVFLYCLVSQVCFRWL
jgi:hypothetical protein